MNEWKKKMAIPNRTELNNNKKQQQQIVAAETATVHSIGTSVPGFSVSLIVQCN